MEKSFNDIIEFRHDSNQPQFKFEELEGAPEVTFKGIFVDSISDKEMKPLEDKEITIDLKGYVFDSLNNQEREEEVCFLVMSKELNHHDHS